jgi:TonB-dependent receptor
MCRRAVLIAWLLAWSGAGLAYGQSPTTGIVEGRVLDGLTGTPSPGAKVTIEGTPLSTSTNRQGGFRLLAVPPGPQVLIVTYLGRKDYREQITIVPGTPVVKEITLLGDFVYEESVTVTAELIAGAQARALNQQKTAPTITNVVSADQIGTFPDANAADSAQRIPGISIQKDQGEGRYVIVRGMEPRLNSVMMDGERIPSPDPKVRQVAVDVVPSDLLQSIEVSKALTPDMDGDAIGGSVNLVMKSAPEKLRVFGSAAFGYNEMLDSYDQNAFAVTAGRRFGAEKKYGLIMSGSSQTANRGNQDLEVTYSNGYLADLDPRFYQLERRRLGLTGAFDIRQSSNSSFTLRGVYNRYIDDHENRQRMRDRTLNARIDRELRDRTHVEHISSLVFGGQQVVRRAELDYKLVGAYSDQDDPLTMTTTFRQTKVTFAPNVTPTSIDPNNIQANPLNENINAYTFVQQLRATNFAKERDVVGLANLRMPLHTTGGAASFLKFGLKYRDKLKLRTRNEDIYTTTSTLAMTSFLDTGMKLRPYLDGRYNLEPYLSQSLSAEIPNLAPMTITRNHARDPEEYDGVERTTAGYVMMEIFAGAKWFLLPGLRYEYTASDYTGKQVLFSSTGAYQSTVPISSTSNYGVALPALHVRYSLTPQSNLRLALTRSFSRPNLYDLVPYYAQNDSDNTISMGNENLKPTTSWNIDLMAEHYFKSVGVVSAGLFYKNMPDYIYNFVYDQTINGVIYKTTQPLNGEAAQIRGFEVAVQNQLAFLPSPLNGFGIYANYTFSDSTATFPSHPGTSSLPGQSRHVGNLAVSYEKGGFSGRVSTTFHGSYVDVIGLTDLLDRYYDASTQIDVSVNQRVTKKLRLFMDLNNLNDALLRYYEGVPDRPQQEEHYHWGTTFGVKIDF